MIFNFIFSCNFNRTATALRYATTTSFGNINRKGRKSLNNSNQLPLHPGVSSIVLVHESPHDLDRKWEHDGGVSLGGDGGQSLQISEVGHNYNQLLGNHQPLNSSPELQSRRGGADDVGSILQSLGGLLLALRLDNLGLGLSGGLGLGCHGPLELLWKPHILDLNPLNPRVKNNIHQMYNCTSFHCGIPDAPWVRGFIQESQHCA